MVYSTDRYEQAAGMEGHVLDPSQAWRYRWHLQRHLVAVKEVWFLGLKHIEANLSVPQQGFPLEVPSDQEQCQHPSVGRMSNSEPRCLKAV